ncbi:CLUMA_CG006841, isoform A [Clunio marinus]|uniref:CLUMA_CG006841, isoform A n=1 Tax=Clunio marinus TaxID=568069 RepID=A0A1J1I0J7_9DIPT|nr:CLUMA_CG006841, isoform A [Clunio marinus]
MRVSHLSLFILLMLTGKVLSANPCDSLTAGTGTIADPDDCSKYYTCIAFLSFSSTCRSYQVFDSVKKTCVAGNQNTCLIYDTEASSTDSTYSPSTEATESESSKVEATSTAEVTTEASTTSETTEKSTIDSFYSESGEMSTTEAEVDLDSICHGTFFGARPYPGSRKLFIGCIYQKGRVLTCRSDDFFHPILLECLTNFTELEINLRRIKLHRNKIF